MSENNDVIYNDALNTEEAAENMETDAQDQTNEVADPVEEVEAEIVETPEPVQTIDDIYKGDETEAAYTADPDQDAGSMQEAGPGQEADSPQNADEGPASDPLYTGEQPERVQTEYETASVEEEEETSILGLISMIFGILSVTFGCCGFCCMNGWLGIIMSTTALVLGIVSLVKGEKKKGMAIAGIVCGGVGLLIAIVIFIGEPFSYAFNSIEQAPIEEYLERFEESL